MGKENAMKFFRITLCTLLLALTGCFDGYGPDGIDPGPGPDYDYELRYCGQRYTWNGVFYDWRCPDGGWRVAPNYPIFTSSSDCHNAKHIEAAKDTDVWDSHDPARKDVLRASGWAIFYGCFEV